MGNKPLYDSISKNTRTGRFDMSNIIEIKGV